MDCSWTWALPHLNGHLLTTFSSRRRISTMRPHQPGELFCPSSNAVLLDAEWSGFLGPTRRATHDAKAAGLLLLWMYSVQNTEGVMVITGVVARVGLLPLHLRCCIPRPDLGVGHEGPGLVVRKGQPRPDHFQLQPLDCRRWSMLCRSATFTLPCCQWPVACCLLPGACCALCLSQPATLPPSSLRYARLSHSDFSCVAFVNLQAIGTRARRGGRCVLGCAAGLFAGCFGGVPCR